MKKVAMMVITVITIIASLTGCGSSGVSESDLKSILPDTITSYEFEDEIVTQDVSRIDITRADINDNYEYMECEITLKDENLERVVYAEMELTKYEVGGWQVDYWAPMSDEAILSVSAPGEDRIDSYMNGLGYYELASSAEYDSGDGYYSKEYQVNETHEYADFSGTVLYNAELAHIGASNEGWASYAWIESADFSQIVTSWKVEGTWEGTEINADNNRPDKFEIRIDSIEPDGEVIGSGKYYYPAFDGNEYLGRFGNYDYTAAGAYIEGSSPADATMTISVDYEAEWIKMNFTPDGLTVTARDLMGDQEFDYTRS